MTHKHHGADRVQKATLPQATAAMNMMWSILLNSRVRSDSCSLPSVRYVANAARLAAPSYASRTVAFYRLGAASSPLLR
jgi:hypothetical protein